MLKEKLFKNILLMAFLFNNVNYKLLKFIKHCIIKERKGTSIFLSPF